MARTQDNIYKAPHTANKRYKKHRHSERISYCHFSILSHLILYSFVLTWASETLWQAPHRWPFWNKQPPHLRRHPGKGLDPSGHIQFDWQSHPSSIRFNYWHFSPTSVVGRLYHYWVVYIYHLCVVFLHHPCGSSPPLVGGFSHPTLFVGHFHLNQNLPINLSPNLYFHTHKFIP